MLTIALSAQCIILGPAQFSVGQTVTFSVPFGTAQCTECYDWDINNSNLTTSGNVQIIGSDQSNTVSILGLSAGTFDLSVTYFDETGCHFCVTSYIITSCDIDQYGIYYVNQYGSEYLKFYTMPSIIIGGQNNYSYLWTFTYEDGTSSSSTDREPYIPVFCSNPIINASVLITSSICSKTINDYGWGSVCGSNHFYSKHKSIPIIKVGPNPTRSLLYFEGKNLHRYKISIFNQTGKLIISNSNLKNISVVNFLKGIYFYRITGPSGFRQSGSIVKE